MEQLTKQQIVLVAILISFVTSIATGIVTVALMSQAPPGITQTINRVVEKTIEKVVQAPAQNQSQQSASVITKETIVVKEDDLVVSAVEKNTRSIVSLYAVLGNAENRREVFLGNGLIVGKDGSLATDSSLTASILDDNQNPITPQTFKAVFSDGSIILLSVVSSDDKVGLAFFKPKLDEKTKAPVFVPAQIADVSALKLGQTVIALGGEKVSVATGIVSNISQSEIPASADTATATASTTPASKNSTGQIIKTDMSAPGKTLGGILVNLSGDVVGIRTLSAGNADNSFLTASAISKLLQNQIPAKPPQTN